MYFQPVALLSLSLFGASSGRLHDIVTDFEDVATCGAKKKQFCNEGPFFQKIKKKLIDAPVVEGFYVDADETEAAQGAINDLIFYFQKKCKNCVEEEAKDELCALKDPIYQGIFDWVSDTMKDTVATYCPPEDFVCGKKHYDHCNGDLYSKMTAQLKSTPKNGGVAAPEALNELNGFFTHVCKSCVDHGNAKALCDSTKAITAGIINNDDREYEDPTTKFCGELFGTPPKQDLPSPLPKPIMSLSGESYSGSGNWVDGVSPSVSCSLGSTTKYDNDVEAFHFDYEKSSLITCPLDISPARKSALTIEVIFKFDKDFNAAKTKSWIIGHDNSGYDRSIILTDTRFGGAGTGVGYAYTSGLGNPSVDVWHHAIATWDQNKSGKSFLCIDGKCGKKVTAKNNSGYSTFTIGGLTKYANHGIKGHVKSVKIWGTAFDDALMKQAYEMHKMN
jgi:hypothetical protein